MQPLLLTSSRFGWIHTLKFKIVAMAVTTGVLSALATTQWVLVTTQANIQRLLVQGESNAVERTATLLGTKVDMLRDALKAVARHIQPALWDNPEAMQQYLADNQGLNALFENVLAARPDGTTLTLIAKDKISTERRNIADRAYFQQALATDQPVLSDPLVSKIMKTPVVVVAMSTQSRQNHATGVIAGVLQLESNNLFSGVTRANQEDGARELIMNRTGVLLAHTDPAQLLGQAVDEPGFAEVFKRWFAMGSPIDTVGSATLSQKHLIAMAGIPYTEWTLVRIIPLALVLQPVEAAHATAWRAATGVGLLVAVLAGGMAWRLTRPISILRARAEKMLLETDISTEGWPQDRGEVGQLAKALQQVKEQRQQKHGQTLALLSQLEAVLDLADVGIALTRNGAFELVSQQFCQLFQWDRQDVIGRPSSLIHPSAESYQALSDRAYPAFMESGTFDGELQLARSTGELFWAHMRGRAVVPGDRSQGTIWTVEDITTSRAHRERLAWASSHDALTGLANRPAFEDLLARSTERAGITPFCAMFIDLDYFKQVNDTGGHAAGDALLRDVAQTLLAQVRQSDTVARLGGDEFAILLGACPLAQALDIGEKLRSAVDAYRLPWEGQSFSVSTSIGLVAVDGRYTSVAEVLRDADIACYQAKERGRNAVVAFQGEGDGDSPPTPPF